MSDQQIEPAWDRGELGGGLFLEGARVRIRQDRRPAASNRPISSPAAGELLGESRILVSNENNNASAFVNEPPVLGGKDNT